jgi:hypothetical protein
VTRRRHSGDACSDHPSGFTGFLRSLLSGIPWSDRAEGEDAFDLERPAGSILRLRNANGHTHVMGEDRENVRVVARKISRAESEEAAKSLLDAIRIVSQETGDALELEVEVPRKWNRRGHANLDVHVPRDLRVEVNGVNGRVEIEGLRGAVQIRSSNGSANVHDTVGDIDVATSNAKVSCHCTCGRLVARSSNGKIELDGHSGSVDASTSNGLIRASLDKVGKRGVQLATSNGRIVLELPDELDADVDIRVDNGIIRNDRKLCKAIRESNGRVRGRLGNGGTLIKLRTSNGSISLR